MPYDKMNDYIETLFTVFKMVNQNAEQKKDKKMKYIALMIYNYVLKMSKDNEVNLNEIKEPDIINLIPFFEYVAYNNIELYDFEKIVMDDVDITKASDLERFVLTHIYYITQTK
jgi:hypothetical protein